MVQPPSLTPCDPVKLLEALESSGLVSANSAATAIANGCKTFHEGRTEVSERVVWTYVGRSSGPPSLTHNDPERRQQYAELGANLKSVLNQPIDWYVIVGPAKDRFRVVCSSLTGKAIGCYYMAPPLSPW